MQSLENAWSDPDTWGGQVPQTGDYVEIEAGRTVMLDTDTAALKGLAVKGTLIGYDGGPISITSDFIAVEGRFEIGTEADPFENEAVITLTGEDGIETPYSGRIGNRALGVIGTGELSLHSTSGEKVSWTQVATTLEPGATTLSTVDFVDWEPGDKLVIAPSGFDPLQAEEVEVVSTNGNSITFTPPLEHRHLGIQQTYEGKTIDMRAEVGLLSRNIRIQGADDSEFFRDPDTGFTAGFGAHSIFRDDASIAIDGVEFTRTGQSGKAGRYAAHWHLAGDQSGDYIRDTSVHHSFQRAIVMHQSDFITAEDNVAYHVGNHAFIPAEDGNEDGNIWRRNLAVLTYSPKKEHFAFFDTIHPDNSSQGEFRSSGFWMRSTNHVFEDNVSAGAYEGMGFFFDRVAAIRNTAESDMVFRGNRAHTTHRLQTGHNNALTYKEITRGHALMIGEKSSDRDELLFSDFQAYSSFGGIWTEDRNNIVRDSIISDNGTGVFMMKGTLDDVVVVGESEAGFDIPEFGSPEYFREFYSGGVQAPPSHGQIRAPVLKNVSIVNQKDIGYFYNREEIGYGTEIEALNVTNTPVRAKIAEIVEPIMFLHPYFGAIDDPNGQLRDDGVPARWVRKLHPIITDDCDYDHDVQAYACDPEDSARIRFMHDRETPSRLTDMTTGYDFRLDNRHDSWGFLLAGRPYFARWSTDHDAGTSLSATISKADGKSVHLVFPVDAAPTNVFQGESGVPMVDGTRFDASAGPAAHYDSASGLLHVKFRGQESYDIEVEARFSEGAARHAPANQPATDVQATTPGLAFAVHSVSADDDPLVRPDALGGVIRTGTADGLDTGVWDGAAGTSVVYSGFIDIPQSGYYRFALDNARSSYAQVRINGTVVTGRIRDTLSSGDRAMGGDMLLEAGLHPFEAILSHDEDVSPTPELDLFWRRAGQSAMQLHELPEVPASAFRH